MARRRTSRRDCKLEVVKLVTRRAWLQLGQPGAWMFTPTCCARGLVCPRARAVGFMSAQCGIRMLATWEAQHQHRTA